MFLSFESSGAIVSLAGFNFYFSILRGASVFNKRLILTDYGASAEKTLVRENMTIKVCKQALCARAPSNTHARPPIPIKKCMSQLRRETTQCIIRSKVHIKISHTIRLLEYCMGLILLRGNNENCNLLFIILLVQHVQRLQTGTDIIGSFSLNHWQ